MRQRQRIGRVIVAVITLMLVTTACGDSETSTGQGGTTTTPGAKQGGVFRVPIGEPRSIDPYNTRESEGTNVNKLLFVGLVTFDGNSELKMRPGVAERWTSTDDCMQWTFNLRRSKFSNGEDVDAQAFIRGWTRAVDAKSASQVAYHLSDIAGYKELHGSPQTATTFTGLSAPDPQTLVVRLTEPNCEFDKKTLAPPLNPVPSIAGAADNQAFNDAPIGNGPYMIKPGTKWEHNRGISLVRNDTYFGAKPSLDGVEFLIFPAQGRLEAEYRAFTAGEADFARIPPTLFQQAEGTYKPQGSWIKDEMFGINYILTNDDKGPIRNADARRAVSLAIDRDGINKGVYQGSLTPATSLLSPPFGTFFQPGVCDACKFDPVKAKELAAKGGLTPGTRLRLSYNNDGGHEPLVQAWKDQLEKNLGVVVDLDGVPFAQQLEQRDAGEFDIARSGWTADYPTPENFLFPLLGSTSEDNDGKYANPEFDALVAKARGQKNEADRKRSIQQAEQIAIGRDVALIPTFYRTQYRVFDSRKFTGVELDFYENPTIANISLK